MKIQLRDLRKIVREIVSEVQERNKRKGSHPEDGYNDELLDDPNYKEKSVYVPDDVKKKIDSWAKSMRLNTR
jgi:basic membrane lipoprotein Med (substrate-binding protein (PBP1-ABC) superfamily)